MKIKGFTLAEVLITLGIIGVVAAITIPTLMQKIDDRETISKVKLGFSTISNAIKLTEALNGDNILLYNNAYSEDYANYVAEYIKPQFKIIQDCGTNDSAGKCIHNGYYKHLNGSNHTNYSVDSNVYKIMLTNGMSILWHGTGSNLDFFVDINGPKGPNVWGRDFFEIIVYNKDNKTLRPEGFQNNAAQCSTLGYGCAYYIMTNNNMDYLH